MGKLLLPTTFLVRANEKQATKMTSREVRALQQSLDEEERGIFMKMVMGSKRKRKESPPQKEKSPQKKKKNELKKGGKGKGQLSNRDNPAFQARAREQQKEELKEALQRSCVSANIPMMTPRFRAMVDVSESEEDEYLDRVVSELMREEDEQEEECQEEEEEDEDEQEEECQEEEEEDEDEQEECQEDKEDEQEEEEEDEDEQEECREEEEDEQEGEDDDDYWEDEKELEDEEEWEGEEEPEQQTEGPREKPSKHSNPKKKSKQQNIPDSDNDPDSPNIDEDVYAPDNFGWTRSLHKVKVQKFQGPKPEGPSFHKSQAEVDYFFQFFPLAVLALIAGWTNVNIKKAGQHVLTSTKEIKAWFGIIRGWSN